MFIVGVVYNSALSSLLYSSPTSNPEHGFWNFFPDLNTGLNVLYAL